MRHRRLTLLPLHNPHKRHLVLPPMTKHAASATVAKVCTDSVHGAIAAQIGSHHSEGLAPPPTSYHHHATSTAPPPPRYHANHSCRTTNDLPVQMAHAQPGGCSVPFCAKSAAQHTVALGHLHPPYPLQAAHIPHAPLTRRPVLRALAARMYYLSHDRWSMNGRAGCVPLHPSCAETATPSALIWWRLMHIQPRVHCVRKVCSSADRCTQSPQAASTLPTNNNACTPYT